MGILGEASGKDLKIFISFPGVSFSMLIHQNECIVGSGSFSGQFHLQRISSERDWDPGKSALHSLEGVKHLFLCVLG